MKIFAYVVIGVVAIAVVAGFFVIGSPQDERLRRFDEARVNDLSSMQYQIIEFWRDKGNLPQVLSDLQNDLSYFNVPVDPETKEQYEYRILGEYQFELCANFAKEKTYDDYSGPYTYGLNSKWTHSAGRACFARTIDPELFKNDVKSVIPLR